MAKIENETQFECVMQRIEELLPHITEEISTSDPRYVEYTLLCELAADYSDEHYDLGTPTLVEMLKLRMYELGMNQVQLAKKIGISAARISDYLTGKREPSLKVARRMSRELNIDPAIALGV